MSHVTCYMLHVMKIVIFLKEVRSELTKVKWPTRPEVIKMTSLVILISLLVGIYVGAVDFTLTKIMEVIVK